jgi:hypothetical protein
MFGHAKGLGRGYEHTSAATNLKGNSFCGEGIGANGTSGTVLFGGTQGHDYAFAAL